MQLLLEAGILRAIVHLIEANLKSMIPLDIEERYENEFMAKLDEAQLTSIPKAFMNPASASDKSKNRTNPELPAE